MTATARPGRLRRLLPHLQAGLCVAVLMLWSGGVAATLVEKGVIGAWQLRQHTALLGVVAVVVAVACGCWLGYRERKTSVASLALRALASVGFGAVWGYLLAAAGAGLLYVAFADRGEALLPWSGPVGAVALLGLLGRIQGFWVGALGGRMLRVAALSVATALSIWPLSPRLRCGVGSGEGCRHLGLELHTAGKDTSAVQALTRACERGDEEGCVWLASYLDFGVGTPRDSARAAQLVQTSCQNLELCFELFEGLGLSPDTLRLEAALHYQGQPREQVPGCTDARVIHDCLGSSGDACLAIARAHRDRCSYYSGSPDELQELRDLYGRACRLGSKVACKLQNVPAGDNAPREGCWQRRGKTYCQELAALLDAKL